jgi:hypothetical protein
MDDRRDNQQSDESADQNYKGAERHSPNPAVANDAENTTGEDESGTRKANSSDAESKAGNADDHDDADGADL